MTEFSSDDIPQKLCKGCKKRGLHPWYPATKQYFYADRSKPDGLATRCKKCKALCCKQWRETHQEHSQEYRKQYRKSHQEEKTAYDKAYYASHRKEFSEYGKMRYRVHREHIRARTKRYYETHKRSEQRRRYRIAHAEQMSPYMKHYRQTHQAHLNELARKHAAKYPEKTRAESLKRQHIRRARIQGNGGSYTMQEIQQQYKRQKGRCYYCKQKLAKYHIEHVLPISRGGMNNMSNIVLACPTCNHKKGAKHLHEWPEGGRLL